MESPQDPVCDAASSDRRPAVALSTDVTALDDRAAGLLRTA